MLNHILISKSPNIIFLGPPHWLQTVGGPKSFSHEIILATFIFVCYFMMHVLFRVELHSYFLTNQYYIRGSPALVVDGRGTHDFFL